MLISNKKLSGWLVIASGIIASLFYLIVGVLFTTDKYQSAMYAILILIIYNALGMLILARSAYQGIAITLAAYLGYLISIASVVSTIVFSTLVLSCITQNEVNCTQSQLVNHTMIMMIIIVFGVITNCILGFSIAFGKK